MKLAYIGGKANLKPSEIKCYKTPKRNYALEGALVLFTIPNTKYDTSLLGKQIKTTCWIVTLYNTKLSVALFTDLLAFS